VVEAAKDLFWEHGYEGSTLADLEKATGLNRSSLYQAFGTKEALFAAALDSYIDGFMVPRLAPMDRPGAGPREVIAFLRGLARLFRADPKRWRRGCLWVNSLAEFSGRELPDSRAPEYRDRLSAAFAKALSGTEAEFSLPPGDVQRRGRMLTAATFGVWLSARVDPLEAARICDDLVGEVRSWGVAEVTPGSPGRRAR
jgi:AcrR family transcriptional regulator